MARDKRDTAWFKAGYRSEYQYRQARKQAREWSDHHSRTERSAYFKRFNAEETRQYVESFVKVRRANDLSQAEAVSKLASLKQWLVDTAKYMTEEEFNASYGVLDM